MNDFPTFMKNAANRIATTDQATPGVDGHVFDGMNGSQMAFWTCSQTASSAAHVHDFDEARSGKGFISPEEYVLQA